jgi:hypothetical protein
MAERESVPSQFAPSQLTDYTDTTEDEERQRFIHLPADTLALHTARPLEELVGKAVAYVRAAQGGK